MKRSEVDPSRRHPSGGTGGRRPRAPRSLERLQGRAGHLSVPILAAALAVALLRMRAEPPEARIAPAPLAGLSIVLDPGHGGADPGAIRAGVSEASLTYRTAATLGAILRREGASVHFTVRSAALEADAHAPLVEPEDAAFAAAPGQPIRGAREAPENLYHRAEIARQVWQSQRPKVAFLSLHFDTLRETRVRGGRALFDRRAGAPPRLARVLARYLFAEGLARSGADGPQPRDLGVLNPEHNPIPDRVLVELATLSNRQDRADIVQPDWRARVARTLADGLIEWNRGATGAP